MDAEIIVPKDKPTLSDVNERLLSRLYDVIEEAGPEELLQITESIAKLNSSYKGNNQFGDPISQEEQLERQQQEMFKNIING